MNISKNLGRVTKVLVPVWVGLLPLATAAPVLAASANLSLSSAASSVPQNGYLAVAVHENSGDTAVNAVQANLSYSTNSLEFASIASAPAFDLIVDNSGGAGSVKIARAASQAVSGDQVVATVYFKAIATGQATVNFTDGSAVESGGNDVTGAKTGATYNVTAASAAIDKIPPAISQVAAKVNGDSVEIDWTTSEPATSEVDFGLSKSYNLTSTSSDYVTDHKVKLNSDLLKQGESFHFVVKSTDVAGNTASSSDGSFSVPGFDLFVKVVDQKNNPVKGAKISLGGHTAVTDKTGQANLSNLTAGNQSGSVTFRHKVTDVNVTVSPNNSDDEQSVLFRINAPADYGPLLWVIGLLVVIALYLWWRRRGQKSREIPVKASPSE